MDCDRPAGRRLRRFLRASIVLSTFGALIVSRSGAMAAAIHPRDQIWLAVSDIHLDPYDRSSRASSYRFDSNIALFESALAAMKRAVPNPSLVLLPGDFFEHHFAQHVRERGGGTSADEAGIATMLRIATAFGHAFPRAHFAIALGNNDAPCGDYRTTNGSAYLKGVARIWEPLVNRDRAAPDFAASFSRDGHYTAGLPMHGLRLAVVNSLLFSQQYRGNCGSAGDGAAKELAWLQRVLRRLPSGTRAVVMMHIPPGFDAFSTQYAHGFLAWPFLRAPYNGMLVNILATNSSRIAFGIAGHTHRFDFRLAGTVPVVILGSLSPIFENNPAFYAMHVSSTGSLDDIDTTTFKESTQQWVAQRGFAATWAISRFDDGSLTELHARIKTSPSVRLAWGAQANGRAPSDVQHAGPWGTRWWRAQWCSQTFLVGHFAECARIEERVTALRAIVPAIALAGIVSIVLAVRAVQRRRRA